MGPTIHSQKMLGAAGRAATGLVKQATKAGNVANVLPAASVAQRREFSVSSPAAALPKGQVVSVIGAVVDVQFKDHHEEQDREVVGPAGLEEAEYILYRGQSSGACQGLPRTSTRVRERPRVQISQARLFLLLCQQEEGACDGN